MESNLYVTINNVQYALACNLRVAYIVQGQHNHKSYTDVFSTIGEMTLEEQIDIIYAAFQCANPDAVKTINKEWFRNYYMDHYNLHDLMEQLKKLISGIMGEPDEDTDAESSEENSNSGN